MDFKNIDFTDPTIVLNLIMDMVGIAYKKKNFNDANSLLKTWVQVRKEFRADRDGAELTKQIVEIKEALGLIEEKKKAPKQSKVIAFDGGAPDRTGEKVDL